MDVKGLKCPGPIVKIADTLKTLHDVDRVYVESTEDAFASDIRVWTERTDNKLIKETVTSGLVTSEIEKSSVTQNETVSESEHDKTLQQHYFYIIKGDSHVCCFLL
ncbi:MAG: sulfurtransferase TusA family protein [Erysipelotrichaceae bacterium]|nr:sulfurtransferase TusA family protein [Erysipelotrichaceae bacterium]